MSVKIITKGQDVYVNRVFIPRHVVEGVNFFARKMPGIYFNAAFRAKRPAHRTGDKYPIFEYIEENVPGLEPEEADALFYATKLAIEGHQDMFELSNSLLNTLSCGRRLPSK